MAEQDETESQSCPVLSCRVLQKNRHQQGSTVTTKHPSIQIDSIMLGLLGYMSLKNIFSLIRENELNPSMDNFAKFKKI